MTNPDDFDKYAKDYRKIHSDNLKISGAGSDHFAEYKVKEIARDLSGGKIKRILDLGCGDGTTSKYLSAAFPKSRIFGIDISQASIEIADDKKLPNCTFKVYDGDKIPFDGGHFDVVFISTVMHHVPRSKHALLMGEAARVLEQKGRLYVFEHNPLNPLTRKLVNECAFDNDAVLLSAKYLKTLFETIKMNNIRVRYTLFFPRHAIFNPLIRFEPYLSFLPLGGQYYVSGEKA